MRSWDGDVTSGACVASLIIVVGLIGAAILGVFVLKLAQRSFFD
jgi:hypothetical protein